MVNFFLKDEDFCLWLKFAHGIFLFRNASWGIFWRQLALSLIIQHWQFNLWDVFLMWISHTKDFKSFVFMCAINCYRSLYFLYEIIPGILYFYIKCYIYISFRKPARRISMYWIKTKDNMKDGVGQVMLNFLDIRCLASSSFVLNSHWI